MSELKVGDPVEYVGPSREIQELSPFVISGFYGSGESQYVKIRGADRWEPLVKNLRPFNPTPAPDVLTIDRAELPEVVEDGPYIRVGDEFYGAMYDSGYWRKKALQQLAVSEFLAAREKAEQEAADQHAAILNKRRDELAVEVAKAAHFIRFADFTYEDHPPLAQAAINMLIERDGKGEK